MTTTKLITVFGATGSQGGSVLKSLASTGLYQLNAITRNANSDKAKQLLTLKNVKLSEANLNDQASIDKALEGSYGVFLVTELALDHKTSTEVQQGKNVIDSAIKNKVSHLVFSGLENASKVIKKDCCHFDNKALIEEYGMKLGDKINFTSIRPPMYYQAISQTLRATKPNEFICTLPMADKPLYCLNIDGYGDCVIPIFAKPSEYKSKIVDVAGDQLKGTEIVDIMNKHLQPNKITYANVSLEQFLSFGFPGVADLTAMFEYFQSGTMKRNIKMTKELAPNTLSFNDWVSKNKEQILKSLPGPDSRH